MIILDFIIIFKEKSEHNLNDLIPNFIRYYGVIRYNGHLLIGKINFLSNRDYHLKIFYLNIHE